MNMREEINVSYSVWSGEQSRINAPVVRIRIRIPLLVGTAQKEGYDVFACVQYLCFNYELNISLHILIKPYHFFD